VVTGLAHRKFVGFRTHAAIIRQVSQLRHCNILLEALGIYV
jgi:hypothetical protein